MKMMMSGRARRGVALFAVVLVSFANASGADGPPQPVLPVYQDPVSKIDYPSLFTIPLTPGQLPPGLTIPAVSSTLPTKIMFTSATATNSAQGIFQTQQAFDLFAWQTFVALNWPAHTAPARYGAPKADVIGTDPAADRVWETFIPPRLVFQNDGPPAPYVPGQARPSNIDAIGKRSHLLNEMDEAFFNLEQPLPPIVDNNTNYARYEIRFNRVQYDYIATNRLYSVEGQKDFIITNSGRITLPDGAIELKVAWKKMGPGDDTNRFFTQLADVLENPYTNSSPTNFGEQYGLIGMHIMYKAPGVPQWAWPTFEHVDNAPVSDLRVTNRSETIGDWRWHNNEWTRFPLKSSYSFYNPAFTMTNAAGQIVPYVTNLSLGGFNPASRAAMDAAQKKYGSAWPDNYYQDRADRLPSQITKVITDNNSIVASKWTAALNAAMQNQLSNAAPNGPWQYYRLLTTQWPVNPTTWTNYVAQHETTVGAGTVRAGNPAPVSIGNAVAETYMQINGSCMNCHAGATVKFHATGGTYGTNQPYSDFSFMFQRAQSAQ